MPRPHVAPVGRLLSGVARTVGRAFDARLAAAGGSRPTWLVLQSLKQQPTASQREIADAVGIHGATLTHHLDAMQDAGLLTRRRDPANRRNHLVELSAEGEAAFLRLRDAAVGFDRDLRRGLDESDVARLAGMLRQLESNVVADHDPPTS